MAIGTSLIIMAIGAILLFAVTTTVAGVSIDAVGVVLLVVGALGVILSFIARGRTEQHVHHDSAV